MVYPPFIAEPKKFVSEIFIRYIVYYNDKKIKCTKAIFALNLLTIMHFYSKMLIPGVVLQVNLD